MAKISPISDARKPDPGVVDILETALKQAKKGEITAIALVKVRSDNQIGISWTYGGSAPYTTLIGGCTLCLKQLTDNWEKKT